MSDPAWFTYDDFTDKVGTEFRLRAPEHELTLVLSGVSEGPAAGGTGPDGTVRQQFALVFRGPADPQLTQGIWELEHDHFGEIGIFLVPLGPDAEGPRYEAVFA